MPKQCLQSKVVHLCNFVTLPTNAIFTLKTLIYGYIGKNRIVLDATQSAVHPSRLVSTRCLDMANVGEEGLALQDVEQWRDWVPLGASTGDREGGTRGAIDTGTA